MAEAKDHLNALWTSARQAADAQVQIVALKATRIAVLGLFGMLGLAALVVFGICGLVLLNDTVAILLSGPGMPPWLSPLVRGVAYVALPAIGFGMLWHMFVGYGRVDSETEEERIRRKSKEALRAAELR